MYCQLCNGSGERKTKRSGTVLACADCGGTGQTSRYDALKADADALAAALIEFQRQDGWPRTVTGRDFAAVHKALDAYRKWLEEGK